MSDGCESPCAARESAQGLVLLVADVLWLNSPEHYTTSTLQMLSQVLKRSLHRDVGVEDEKDAFYRICDAGLRVTASYDE